MENSNDYPYFHANALQEPIDYSYSTLEGDSLLKKWKSSRTTIACQLPNPIPIEPSTNISDRDETSILTPGKIDKILICLQQKSYVDGDCEIYWLSILLKKFEVSKKIYSRYNIAPPHRPPENASYNNLELYIKFSYLMLMAYRRLNKIQYLNAFLKTQDILAGSVSQFNEKESKEFQWLISAELETISNFAKKRDILI